MSEGIFSLCMREVYCYSDPFVLCVICTCKDQLKGALPLVKWSHHALCLTSSCVVANGEGGQEGKQIQDSFLICLMEKCVRIPGLRDLPAYILL